MRELFPMRIARPNAWATLCVRIARELLADQSGAEILEYALVWAFFAVAAAAGFRLIAISANSHVETNETNFANSMAAGQ